MAGKATLRMAIIESSLSELASQESFPPKSPVWMAFGSCRGMTDTFFYPAAPNPRIAPVMVLFVYTTNASA